MNRRIIGPIVALLALLLLLVPETARTTPVVETGFASAYAPGVMEGVIKLRFQEDIWRVQPPMDWYQSAGAIAVMDCSRVGEMATLFDPGGRAYLVLIADCAGADGPPDRFSKHNIILETDHRLWTTLTALHGKPLRVGLR